MEPADEEAFACSRASEDKIVSAESLTLYEGLNLGANDVAGVGPGASASPHVHGDRPAAQAHGDRTSAPQQADERSVLGQHISADHGDLASPELGPLLDAAATEGTSQ